MDILFTLLFLISLGFVIYYIVKRKRTKIQAPDVYLKIRKRIWYAVAALAISFLGVGATSKVDTTQHNSSFKKELKTNLAKSKANAESKAKIRADEAKAKSESNAKKQSDNKNKKESESKAKADESKAKIESISRAKDESKARDESKEKAISESKAKSTTKAKSESKTTLKQKKSAGSSSNKPSGSLVKVNKYLNNSLKEDKKFAESNDAYDYARYIYSVQFKNSSFDDLQVTVFKGYLELSKTKRKEIMNTVKGSAIAAAMISDINQSTIDKMNDTGLIVSLKFY